MIFSAHSLIRFTVIMGVGLAILAVAISHLEPPTESQRWTRPASEVSINDYLLRVRDRQPRWINSETGQVTFIPVEANDVLEAASCSPWVDAAGKRQIIGRWSSRTWSGPQTVSHAFGLGRYTFPEGRMLNQVTCDIVPTGPPCWFPGTVARVLFAAGDGQLYRFAFESAEPSLGREGNIEDLDERPIPLTWECTPPGVGNVFIGDISWPSDPRMGGRILASMRVQEHDATDAIHFTETRIWALKLDDAGTQIVEATPMIAEDRAAGDSPDTDERSPVVTSLPDGSLGLAFTRQVKNSSAWTVCLATLRTDTRNGLIPVRESQIRQFEPISQPAPLSFSLDGQWLNVLTNPGHTSEQYVVRLPTSDRTPRRAHRIALLESRTR